MDRTGKAGLFSMGNPRQLGQAHANLNAFYYILAQAATVVYDILLRKLKKLA